MRGTYISKGTFARRYSLRQSVFRIYMYHVFVLLIMVIVIEWLYNTRDFCLFPKLTGCRYETIVEMKEAMTKVIDTLTQEDFRRAFQKLLERYNKCIATGGDYFEGD